MSWYDPTNGEYWLRIVEGRRKMAEEDRVLCRTISKVFGISSVDIRGKAYFDAD